MFGFDRLTTGGFDRSTLLTAGGLTTGGLPQSAELSRSLACESFGKSMLVQKTAIKPENVSRDMFIVFSDRTHRAVLSYPKLLRHLRVAPSAVGLATSM